jgi:glutamate carboxypeptidase
MSPEISREEAFALRAYLDGRLGEMLRLTRALVETESPSGDLRGSREVVDLLSQAARTLDGVTAVERIESPGYGEHLRVRAFVDEKGSDRTILIVGHTDTVHPRGSLAERPWRVDGNRIYAPGIFDMKANCALALETLRACAALKLAPPCEVVLLLTCDEETGSETGRALVEAEASRARCALVLEPPASGGRVKTGRKGTGNFTMEARGRAAHAGLEPEKGASAILEIARQIERLHGMNAPAQGTTLNVGIVRGGTRTNVVPAEAVAEIDVRFNTMAEARRIEDEIRALQPIDERVKLLVRGGVNRPPLERTDRVAALFELARSVSETLDFELHETSVGGASDGNFVGAMGVPVLDGLGIDGDGAHADHEHIIIDDITRRGALLAGLLVSSFGFRGSS